MRRTKIITTLGPSSHEPALLDALIAAGHKVPVIAKIEKPQAVQNAEGIILAGAGIRVARGDLGVEYPLRKVPLLQKDLITRANHHGRLVIVATQILESRIERPVPTRAEVSDVANAVLEGADAFMLPAEAASGRSPAPAVRTMAEILEEVDTSPRFLALPEAALARGSSKCIEGWPRRRRPIGPALALR